MTVPVHFPVYIKDVLGVFVVSDSSAIGPRVASDSLEPDVVGLNGGKVPCDLGDEGLGTLDPQHSSSLLGGLLTWLSAALRLGSNVDKISSSSCSLVSF
jgi:hypothetical protein